MALDGTGLGLTLLFELSRVAKSIQERNACHKESLVLYDKLDATLARVFGLTESIERIFERNPGTMPHAALPDFVGTLSTVKETLLRADDGLKEYCVKAFVESSSSGCLKKVSRQGKRLLRGRSLRASLGTIERDINEAERRLHILLNQLCTALKIDQASLRSDRNMRRLIEEHVAPKERYRAAFNAPMLPGNVHLDFKSRDANGKYTAPEASLKSCVLMSTYTENATIVRGASPYQDRQPPVHGVSGMAGVGKTIALIGLGHDEDIQDHFVDGVLYMGIGASATTRHTITELWKIMSVTGATASAAAVQSSKSLADAIAIATVWFHGRKILFLIDDIWPTSTRPEGYLTELRGLLQGSPKSRMVISTRSPSIAAKSGSHVDFGARDPCGPNALAIFLAHAVPLAALPPCRNLLKSARHVLTLCAGLPIALSVAGATVALCVNYGDDFEEACQEYAENIEAQSSSYPGDTFLDCAIRQSLHTLAEYQEKNMIGIRNATKYSVNELFVSLCVLKNQQFAPVPVLARMWETSEAYTKKICESFSSLSLARTSSQNVDGRRQRGLNIHDLHLDFCRENARRSGEEQTWHRRLLSGHMSTGSVDEYGKDLSNFNLLDYSPRQWWREDVPNKEYIRKNLSRHLRRGGLELELGLVMLDIRWVTVQGATGGVFGVKNDLDLLYEAMKESLGFATTDESLESVTIISNTIAGMGEILREGIRVISHELYTHLSGLSGTNEWVRQFLERMAKVVPKPFLVPSVVLYRHPVEDLKWDIEMSLPDQNDFVYLSTAYSTCERYGATGANHDVAVYDLDTRSRLKRLKGHQENVSVVKFVSDASKLISGSFDKRVIVWDWMETESPYLIFEGHEGAVSSVCTMGDDTHIVSGSLDGTVRVWEAHTGNFREFVYGSEVECVSSCPRNDLIAVGTRDGRLLCTNSLTGDCVFECMVGGNAAVSTVQFGPDGAVLLSGTSAGRVMRWRTASWDQVGAVSVPGSANHVSFHPDGASVIIGCSKGEIRHWNFSEQRLSKYNVSMARPVNGLSFLSSRNVIIAGVSLGYARVWSDPKSNPNLDFTNFRNNLLFDFDLSADGRRVATSTHDGMIRLWNTDTGRDVAAYSAPADGSGCLALSADGKRIAFSSLDGAILVWNPEMAPSNTDISFKTGQDGAVSLSFSPNGNRLLVCFESGVQIWEVVAKVEKMCQVQSSGNLYSSFSSDGRYVIVGDGDETSIWGAAQQQNVFDSRETALATISLEEAKYLLRTCGPSAHRLWPALFKDSTSGYFPAEREAGLTVGSIFNFVSDLYRPSKMQFSEDVFVVDLFGLLSIFNLQK